MSMGVTVDVRGGDCLERLASLEGQTEFQLTFLDPPFNQCKEYEFYDDDVDDAVYWSWMREVCEAVRGCASLDTRWRFGVFHAAREECGAGTCVLAGKRLDVPKSDRLDEKGVGGSE